MEKEGRWLWIINAFYDYGDMSLKELNERWKRYSLNYDAKSINERTFFRDRMAIASTFQIDIEYSGQTKKYTLANPETIRKSQIYNFLLNSVRISELSELALKHKDKIMLSNCQTGVELLHIILDAIDKKRTIHFRYTSYYAKETPYTFEVIPCFVRLFEERWYLICEYLDKSEIRFLALERMSDLKIGEKMLEPSPSILPESVFKDCYGIIKDHQCPIEIQLKVYDKEVDYVRSVPLHHSQKEIKTTSTYVIFSYYLRPTYDFTQRLLWHLDRVEVLKLDHFRAEIKDIIQKISGRYI